MENCKQALRLFVFFVVFYTFFLVPDKCEAFRDEFNTSTIDNAFWVPFENDASLILNGSTLQLEADQSYRFPFVHTRNVTIPPDGDFIVKIRFKYNSVVPRGTGIVLSTSIPQNGIINGTPLSSTEYSKRHFLEIWQDSSQGFVVSYAGDCYEKPCELSDVVVYQEPANTSLLDIEFQYVNERYHVLLNGNEVFVSGESLIRPSYVWFGNYARLLSRDYWSNFEIDYIEITEYKNDNIFTLILPGMMACWDFKAVLKNESSNNWKLVPGITDKIYRNLSESFSGLDQQAQIWCYDWRRPITDNADTLNDYLTTFPDPPDKINIVGHSMGGLVGRAFAQKYPEKINKLVTLGSPHDGAVKSYPLWAAGQLWEYSKNEKLLFNTLVWLNKDKIINEHPMNTVRRVVPSVQDLLPTFDFLTDPTGENYKNIATHKLQNETMNALSDSLTGPIRNKFLPLSAPTNQQLKL